MNDFARPALRREAGAPEEQKAKTTAAKFNCGMHCGNSKQQPQYAMPALTRGSAFVSQKTARSVHSQSLGRCQAVF